MNFSFKRLSQKDIAHHFNQINHWIKELKQLPFEIVFTPISYRSLGEQSLPRSLGVTQEQFLAYLGKKREFERDIAILKKSFEVFPALKGLLSQEPKWVMTYREVWDRLLRVCRYLSPRQDPISIFERWSIEGRRWYSEIRIRRLATKYQVLGFRLLRDSVLDPF